MKKSKKNKTTEESIVLDMRSMETPLEKKTKGDIDDAKNTAPVATITRTSEDFSVSKDNKNATNLEGQAVIEDSSQLGFDASETVLTTFVETSENSVTIKEGARGGGWNAFIERLKKNAHFALKKLKKAGSFVFIDGMAGMALGLFATLIIGTIISQIGKYVGDNFIGNFLTQIGNAAKIMMGAGIGIGVACKFKKPPLLAVSAGVAGIIGAQATDILDIINKTEGAAASFIISKAGEPVGAFIAALIAITVGGLVAGKTKVDIIITPLVAIIAGAIAGLIVGPPVSAGMTAIGSAIEWATEQNRFVMGIVVAVLMGMALTAPISSAALGIGLGLGGIAAGAATVGCCCQMIGFAVSSFRENKWGGLAAQGLGTSMLQMPNIVKRPIIWLPSIIASMILGPISSALLGMTSNDIGSGMGTAGLVGPIMAFETMVESGRAAWRVLLEIGLMHFILPALICLAITELMRKLGWIKYGDMRLNIN